MAMIDSSVQNFVDNPRNYLLRVVVREDSAGRRVCVLTAEEKGFCTWFKANIFDRSSYKLGNVLDTLADLPTIDSRLRQVLSVKITHFNDKHEDKLTIPWSFTDIMASQTVSAEEVFAVAKKIKNNVQSQFQLWQKGASMDHPGAMHELGNLYRFGKAGVDIDVPKAIEWYEKAALKGSGIDCQELTNIYWQGEGVPKDLEKAEKWLKEAFKHKSRVWITDEHTSRIFENFEEAKKYITSPRKEHG